MIDIPAASALRVAGEMGLLARNPQRPLVIGNDAGEDLHQRAFAGPVLTDDGVEFARSHVKAHRSQDAVTPGNRLVMFSTAMMGFVDSISKFTTRRKARYRPHHVWFESRISRSGRERPRIVFSEC